MNSSQDEADKEKYRSARDRVTDILNNIEAEKINEEGMNAYDRGEFNAAKDRFDEALRKCSSDYKNREIFRNNRNKVMGKIFNEEGKELFKNGNYLKAVEKYREAQRYQKDDQNSNSIAECYYELGIQFFNQKNHEKAKEFSQKAADECTSDHKNEKKFKFRVKNVFNDVKNQKAEAFYTAGNTEFNDQNFESAKSSFVKAYNECTTDYSNKKIFKDSADAADAAIYNQKAIKLHNEGKYHEAVEEHIKAQKTIPRDRVEALKKYKNDLANSYSEIGKKHLLSEKFDDAKKYFELAIGESSEDFEDFEAFASNLRKSEDCIRNKNAENLFNRGKTNKLYLKY